MAEPGRIFEPGPSGSWDEEVVSCPVVLREGGRFRMWYYGRERNFPGGAIEGGGDGIPMGRTGLAESSDGIHFVRVAGPGHRGAVLDPSGVPGRFDSWQVGGTDVTRVGDLYSLYFMGAWDGATMVEGHLRKGFPLRIGLARSTDGLHFERVDGPYAGAVLTNGAPGEWDEWFVGWPRILALPGGGWRMYYHGAGPTHPRAAGIAESADGVHWEKRGVVLAPTGNSDDFDCRAISTRHVIPWQGGYLMAYEALPAESRGSYRIGIATSPDGLRWERLRGPLTLGCVLDVGPAGTWDSLAIGTPYLVPDGAGLLMYYVGFGPRPTARGVGGSIGLARCDGRDLTRWEKVSA
ncbi:MAG: glycosyl hydrolase [Chloroflexota bacterium]|nr:glycosyl hydrolase [Dehalococcoidia bacterium]MDW8253428.1 glycosyl hydrolase [Chloroflexota bacterium]